MSSHKCWTGSQWNGNFRLVAPVDGGQLAPPYRPYTLRQINTYIYIYLYTYIYIYTHTHYIYIYRHIHLYIHIIFIHIYIYIHIGGSNMMQDFHDHSPRARP